LICWRGYIGSFRRNATVDTAIHQLVEKLLAAQRPEEAQAAATELRTALSDLIARLRHDVAELQIAGNPSLESGETGP
jgi:hypothetical protein